MSGKKECAHIVVTGRVQGVFFRATAEETALGLGLTGWVKNCGDGSVEILAEGDRAALEKLIKWCNEGPPMARVKYVAVDWQPATGRFDTFETTY
ncbi:MAG: acylphosphatase [Nitrospinae bacterium]|nr:acylphosphatase [Nitrospinota bacterium]